MMVASLANVYGIWLCKACLSRLPLRGHRISQTLLSTWHMPNRFMTTDKAGDPSNRGKKKSSKTDREYFDEMFPELVSELMKNSIHHVEVKDAYQWFKKVCEYNVPCGKKNRGLTVLHSYKCLVKKPTEDDLRLAGILGWCVELFQAFCLVADDIMDNSITRRGQPCWFRQPGVGLKAVNDVLYLENTIYVILKNYFSCKSYYINIMELFHETTLQTITGQCLDLNTTPVDCIDFTHYTLDRYHAIVKWKTAFYSFYLPVALAMNMADITDPVSHNNAKDILLKMGTYFQVQDDFLDCFSDPKITGKIGTDIEDNKCSWLVVHALERCTSEQRKVLQDNYGKKDSNSMSKVKKLYKELHLPELYHQYEEETYKQLMELIDKLSGGLPKEMFVAYVNKIFRRQR